MKRLRVLIVEDSEDDAMLMLHRLRRGGYEPVHAQVDSAETMAAALEHQEWDIVLSDHAMPCFSSTAALALLQERGIDLPFIIVSGAIGEELAVAAMKAGAHDYLLKANLARLAPAVERELREAEERRKRRLAEEALRESEAEILRISEREQSRIGRDLHDGVCQTLVGTAFLADKLGRDLAAGKVDFAAAAASVGEIKNLVRQAAEEARGLAKGLYVVRLEEGSLRSALEDLAATAARLFDISCVVKGDGLIAIADNHEATHIYRIVQEAISNAAKHGAAKSVEVIVASGDSDKAITLTIKDDGCGLPTTWKGEGMGQKTMRYRARVLGGMLEVKPGAHGGTEVICSLGRQETGCSRSATRKELIPASQ